MCVLSLVETITRYRRCFYLLALVALFCFFFRATHRETSSKETFNKRLFFYRKLIGFSFAIFFSPQVLVFFLFLLLSFNCGGIILRQRGRANFVCARAILHQEPKRLVSRNGLRHTQGKKKKHRCIFNVKIIPHNFFFSLFSKETLKKIVFSLFLNDWTLRPKLQ